MACTVISGFRDEIPGRVDTTSRSQREPVGGQPPASMEPIAALEGPRVLESREDLQDLDPDEVALVPLRGAVAKVVWEWSKAWEHDDPTATIARGVRKLLVAWYEDDVRGMLKSTQTILTALSQLV